MFLGILFNSVKYLEEVNAISDFSISSVDTFKSFLSFLSNFSLYISKASFEIQ